MATAFVDNDVPTLWLQQLRDEVSHILNALHDEAVKASLRVVLVAIDEALLRLGAVPFEEDPQDLE